MSLLAHTTNERVIEMKNILSSLFIMLVLISQSALSHVGGHEPVGIKEAIFIASQVSKQFVGLDPGLGFGKLNQSWNNIAEDKYRIHKKGDGYYIVSIENIKEERVLYILMSVSGEVYDANFSGTFPGLKK